MTTTMPSREAIEAAEPIDFEAKRAQATPARQYPARSYAIECVSPAGFHIVITLADIRLDGLDDALGALMERGYMPYEPPALPNPTPAATGAAPATGQPPMCPLHNRPMKVSNYGGWFCTFADPTTGEKCKQKVKG